MIPIGRTVMNNENDRAWHEYVQCRNKALTLIKTGLETFGYISALGRPHGRNAAVFWRERGDSDIHNVHVHPYEHARNMVVPRFHIDHFHARTSLVIKRELGFSSRDRAVDIDGNSDHRSEITVAVQELVSMAVWMPSLIAFWDGKTDYAKPPVAVYGRTGPSLYKEAVPVGDYAWTIEADNAYAKIHGRAARQMIANQLIEC